MHQGTAVDSVVGQVIGFAFGLSLVYSGDIVSYIIKKSKELSGRHDHHKTDEDTESDPIFLSSNAMKLPQHKTHIMLHLDELFSAVTELEGSAYSQLCGATTVEEVEHAAEGIDNKIHQIQVASNFWEDFLFNSDVIDFLVSAGSLQTTPARI